MTTIQKCIAAVVVVGIAWFGYGKYSEPRNYEDCILKNMPSAQNDKASVIVERTCKQKFADLRDAFDVAEGKPPIYSKN